MVLHHFMCCNPSLGLATKARACKVAGQEGSPRVKKSVREWTLTLPKEFPFWEVESWLSPKCSESNCKGQNPMDWRVIYTIGKLLKFRCLKWARITHLDIWNMSYGQKKGLESNWQFDSWPLKLRNWPDFLAFRWRATYHWKSFDEGYNFVLDLVSIGGLHTKLWAPQSHENLNFGNFEIPTWESRDKKPFGCGSRGEAQNIL